MHQAIDAGRFDEALALLQSAAAAQPENPETYQLAGQCLSHLGDHEAALDAFQRAIRIKADWPAPYLGAARALSIVGDAYASMQTLLHVLNFAPQDMQATRQLVALLRRLKPEGHLPALEPALLQCFAHPDVDPSPLTRLCGQQLRLSISKQFNADDQAISEGTIASLAGGELWPLYLSRVINTDPYLEELLSRLRRHFCLNTVIENSGAAPVALITALAQQCFLNEFVFAWSNEEATRLAEIENFLGETRQPSESVALALALSCLYRSPRLDSATRELAEVLSADYPWIESLCRITVVEPFEEAQLAEKLPTLHPVHDKCSLAVQAQYEANPYPRWQAPPTPPKSALVQSIRRRFSLRTDVQQEVEGARILVAGCGTGFEPIDIARRDNTIAVTAIDLSRRSLAYAKRQAQALGCTNIEFYEGDILNLHHTDWQFDLIVCTGVLHHMADPLAGWKALRDRLAATGMMRISLYSALARRAVRIAREQIQVGGLAGEADDIRRFRQRVLGEARDSELAVLLHSDDFYSMSGCRDLLFHAQEQQFTLPRIQSALDELDLRFCGFDLADASLLRAFTVENPAPEALRDLEKWDSFEQADPNAFSGMYQFWCEHE